VLGHEKCGAVTAACQGGECPPNIQAIMDKLKGSVEAGEKDVEKSVVKNALAVADEIREKSGIVRKLEEEGKLKIVPMKYYFGDGRVEIVE
jgi:carbonic anhydrase